MFMGNLFYENGEHQCLFWLLESSDFTSALVYLVCRRNYGNLKITANQHSIEIWNDELTIVILLSAAFEKRHYESIKNNLNLHVITFSSFFNSDFNFDIEEIYIKTITTKEWFSEVLKRSKNEEIKRLYQLSNLKISLSTKD
jgi:hypothetical protein